MYGETHTWDFDDGETITSGPGNDEEAQLNIWGEEVSHTFTKPGLYNVVLTVEGDGGIDQTNNIVEVYPKPDVSFDIAPTTVMLPEEKIQTFNSTVSKPDYQWLWNFGDGEMSTSKEPDHLYTELGTYDISLVVWTENMCVDSLVLEQIVSVEGTGLMEFPNAFIPSLNGPNGGSYSINQPTTSVFHPYHDGVVDYRLEIYTRWGELIYVSEDVHIGWDGYINGSLAKQDVYVWRVKGTYTKGSPFVKAGDVTLVVSPNQYE
jgi:PKD repeat protein